MGLLSEYIQKKLGVVELEKELMRLIKEYNKLRNSFLLVYSACLEKPIPNISLNMDDYYIIFDFLKNTEVKNLDVYIETPGGSGEAAEEIVEYIHKKFDKVSFIVSGEAKSAGTLMVLCGHEILMTESGSLGPIDAQIRIGRSTVSAYDYMEWVDEKRKEAVKNDKLNPFDATMVAQISPGELNGVSNPLDFAKDLVIEWLPKYKFKNWVKTETTKKVVTEEMKKKRAEQIVKELINHKKWRSHGRSLKINELENMGLKIAKIDDDQKLADIVYRIQTVIKLIFHSSNTYKITATEKEKIVGIANPIGKPVNLQPKEPEVVELDVVCPKCGKHYKLYAKFIPNAKIDQDFQKKGFKKFPTDNKLNCECGFEIDLTPIRGQIESQTGKKIID